jgi:hypothetical protein
MMNKQIYFCILAALGFVLIGQVPFIPFTLSGCGLLFGWFGLAI